MQKIKYLIPLFTLLSSIALADEVQGIYFIHKDWEIACDNTRTCRAAGYQAEEGATDEMPQPVSVLLTRLAGPNAPVTGRVRLAEYEDAPPSNAATPLVLRIDGKMLGNVKLDPNQDTGELSAPQVRALITALGRTSRIEFTMGKQVYRLSGAGAAAVLLKMDDFQGRVGTPGALMRKGRKDESTVLPPVPAPELTIPQLNPLGVGDKELAEDKSGALHRALRQTLQDPEACVKFNDQSQLTLARLSGGKLLVFTECWLAAYNGGFGYWVIEERTPFHPVLVTTDANDYEGGIITSAQKGRGLGDCWGHDAWSWNGSQFVHSDSGTTGMCKLVAAGGAWDLPTLVMRVHNAGR